VASRTFEDRCSLRSLAANEPLAATASTIRWWLLLEHPGPWGRDGLLDARLPDGLGVGLRELERRTGARALLIRRPDRRSDQVDGRVRCFGIDTRDSWLGSHDLDRIEGALELDPRDRSTFSPDPGRPLFVVCTHGRRDPCCAEQGRPVADRLRREFHDGTWESTHVGGDRFAANLVAFPHGLYFGRVEPDEAPAIARGYTEGRIARLPRYRGRSSDPRHVQAAERALRGELALDRIGDVRLLRQVRRGDAADVTLATPRGDVRVELERALGSPLRLTCHATETETPVIWRVVAMERVGA
jgi:hypothetical protein